MKPFRVLSPGTPDHKEALSSLRYNIGAGMSEYQLFLLQYTKLANYFGDQLDTVFGGDYLEHRDTVRIRLGMFNFMDCVESLKEKGTGRFVQRKDVELAWGPENIVLSSDPAEELGLPFEPYLSVNNSLLNIVNAGRILCIDSVELTMMKLRLLLDEEVIRYTLNRMLLPRTEWSSIPMKRGGRSKALLAQPRRSTK